jgi:hypothetical protein
VIQAGIGRRRTSAALIGLAALLVACGQATQTPTSRPTATPTRTPASSAQGHSIAPSAAAAPTASPTVAPTRPDVGIDTGLLRLLPETVDGHPVEESAEAAIAAVSDPALGVSADSIAVGAVFDPASESFAVASVVRLKPGVYDEEFFRDWRDSFDEGVCAQAGGVEGNAEAEIDGRTVYIGTCAGGVHTYHVYLEDSDTVISVNALGEARLGERMMETLPE